MIRFGKYGLPLALAMILASLQSCKPDEDICDTVYDCTPYNYTEPYRFPDLIIPEDNPLTIKKVELGKKLFYEEKLSASQTMSCGTCHGQAFGFTDSGNALSINDLGQTTMRNTSQLFNMAWIDKGYFWDGRVMTLEAAVEDAIINEQHPEWSESLTFLNTDPEYDLLFDQSFQDGEVSQQNVIKALASFIRTMNSSDAKIDRFFRGEYQFTELEQFGFDSIFLTEKGDCFHCHGVYPFMSDHDFHNNGLQEGVVTVNDFNDIGLGAVTGNESDYGKMKTPSLRNLSFTAPYMHDGRLETIDDVIDFYSEGLHFSPTVDPLMKKVNVGGIQLSEYEKEALKAFLLTFDDPVFINNQEFADPD